MATDRTGLEYEPQGTVHGLPDPGEFTLLDDSTLLAWRAGARGELERLPPMSFDHAVLTARYDMSTREVNDRAHRAWSREN